MKKKADFKSLVFLVISMLVFGTVGIFSKHIPLPPGVIAFSRAVIGLIFLTVIMISGRQSPDTSKIKENLKYLIPSGIALALNWILFFSACRTTTVPTATLAYYLAPVLIVVASAIFFKEKMSKMQIAAIILSAVGIILSSGIIGAAAEGVSLIGISYGLLAAVSYAAVVILNKRMKDIDSVCKTAIQFAVSAAALLPYIFIAESAASVTVNFSSALYLVIIGILHTGITYCLYFYAAARLPAVTVAVYSYIDPITAILVSTLIFSEPIDAFVGVGAALIIGASLLADIGVFKTLKKEKTTDNANDSSQIHNTDEKEQSK